MTYSSGPVSGLEEPEVLPHGTQNGVHHEKETLMPIAIVGMACRLPGGVSNTEDLWEMCAQSRSGWSEVPKTRFNAEAFYHPNLDKPGCIFPQGGNFLDGDVSLFDAPFFRITAKEAKAMDPQQRMLIECTYEALENAGISLHSIAGKNVGVFAGGSFSQYVANLFRDPETCPMFQITGTADAMMSNRLSYLFDLKGPSFTVDTACSSSLTALHLACQSIRTGESSMAIVGSCHLNITPDEFITMSMSRLLSKEGKSFAYDNRGTSGFGKGEGAGVTILKPLRDAIKAGDRIRAVIRNTGLNQDGKTAGITMPSGDAQEALIRTVYDSAGLDPSETGYIESHGTGTATGDPIEAAALGAIFGNRNRTTFPSPIYVGSLKSNVGHLEGASGIVSLIKTAMIVEKGFILPNCDFKKINEKIPLATWNMKVPTRQVKWPNSRLRRASVCNYGFGGANAHVVVEQFQHSQRYENSIIQDAAVPSLIKQQIHLGEIRRLIVLSANDEDSIKCQIADLLTYLSSRPESFYRSLLASLALTFQRRTLFSWNIAVSINSKADLVRILENSEVVPKRCAISPRIAFIFTGQGAQWFGMGRELMQTYPVFASTIQAAERSLQDLGAKWSLIDELSKDEKSSIISAAYISQPACTAIQIALVELLFSWDIRPKAVTGHSSGEIAAAYAAGALDLETCMSIAFHRGTAAIKLQEKFPEVEGAMLAVGASQEEVQDLLNKQGTGRVVAACINSPQSITVSGDKSAVCEVESLANQRNIFNRKVQTDVAYHSHHMRLISEDYRGCLQQIRPRASTGIKFHSSLTGHLVDNSRLGTTYWVNNLMSPVLFSSAVQSLCSEIGAGSTLPENQIDTLIEIGPHAALKGPVRQILKTLSQRKTPIDYLSTLTRNEDAVATTMDMAATLFMKGCHLNLPAINFPTKEDRIPQILTDIRPYPWKHTEKYWSESRISENYRLRSVIRNDVLGIPSPESNDLEPKWRNIIRPDDIPWLRHHKVHSNIVYPMVGYIAMAIEACQQRAISRGLSFTKFLLREVSLSRALVIPESSEIETTITLRPYNASTRLSTDIWDEFRIFSWSKDRGWNEHCRGLIGIKDDTDPKIIDELHTSTDVRSVQREVLARIESSCDTPIESDEIYKSVEELGMEYGQIFKGLNDIRYGSKAAVATVSIPDTGAVMPHQFENELVIHPVLFDILTHILWVILIKDPYGVTEPYLPSFIKSISVSRNMDKNKGGSFRTFSSRTSDITPKQYTASFSAVDLKQGDGLPVVEFEGMVLSRVSNANTSSKEKDLSFKIDWKPHLDFIQPAQYQEIFAPKSMSRDDEYRCQINEQASLYFIESALSQLSPECGDLTNSHLGKCYRWMETLSMLAKETTLMPQSKLVNGHDPHIHESIIQQSRLSGLEGELLCTIGEILPQILRGEVDALSIMNKERLFEEYRESSLEQNFIRAARYVDLLAHQNPHLKVLEIGVGMSSIKNPPCILNTLGAFPGGVVRFLQYDYTHRNNYLLKEEKERFDTWDVSLNYLQLDIEQDPLEQGFAPEDYDLIIAADITHAKRLITSSMRNLRKLLKPGGRLVLIEETQCTLRNFPLATLPGSWSSREPGNDKSPFLSEQGWDDLLKLVGFSGLDGSIQDFPGPHHTGSVMFSTAASTIDIRYQNNLSIISSDSSTQLLASNLKSSLKSITKHMPEVISLADVAATDLNSRTCIFLDELDKPFLTSVNAEQFGLVQKLCTAGGIIWAVRGAYMDPKNPNANMVLGLARTVRSENAAVKFVTLDLDYSYTLSDPKTSKIIAEVFKQSLGPESLAREKDMEFSGRKGLLHIPRLVEDKKLNKYALANTRELTPEIQPFSQPGRPLQMKIKSVGSLDSFYFEDQDVEIHELLDDNVKIQIKAMGMNFKDIMVSLGQIDADYFGAECSGVLVGVGPNVKNLAVGDRVCGVPQGSYATYGRCKSSGVAKIPDDMSFAVAASMPTVYCTAYYSLIDIARLLPGETILIHAAAGGVGQAAINLAQMVGAEVYATVGSVEKKLFLIKTYGIADDHIFYSRTTSFGQGIREATGGRGVDVVLNSLGGDALRIGWECLAHFGRFIEIGKRDIVTNTRLEMVQFANNATFASVDLAVIMKEKPQLIQRLLSDVMSLYEKSAIKAIVPVTTYPVQDIEKAFRLLQSGKNTGKIVVEPRDSDLVMAIPPPNKNRMLRSDATYLITGGSGGLGRSMANWLVQQGVRYIILASRRGVANPKVQSLVYNLEKSGAKVVAHRCDITKEDEVEKMIYECETMMPPIRGVIHGAMVLHDVLFEKLTFEEYTSVVAPKVRGAWNMHNCLSKTDLDFFVMLSSSAGIVGSRGQAAYAASSTFLGAFAHWRNAQNLPADTIHLGAVSEVGFIAENQERDAQFAATYGDQLLTEKEFLGFVQAAIEGQVSESANHECVTSLKLTPESLGIYWAAEAKFSHCRRVAALEQQGENFDGSTLSIGQSLKQARTKEDVAKLVYDSITMKFCAILMIPTEDIVPSKPVVAYGLDSLVAVEIRNWFARELDAKVQLLELTSGSSLEALAEMVVMRSSFVPRRFVKSATEE